MIHDDKIHCVNIFKNVALQVNKIYKQNSRSTCEIQLTLVCNKSHFIGIISFTSSSIVKHFAALSI